MWVRHKEIPWELSTPSSFKYRCSVQWSLCPQPELLAYGFKMTWVSLQMISLGSLLFFTHQTSFLTAAPAKSSRCISAEQLSARSDRFLHKHWDRLHFDRNKTSPQRTCAQAAEEIDDQLANRSFSPWKYSVNRDVDRIPSDISFAECLCQGCIINRKENLSYNSVLVFAPMMVMRKTKCDGDPKKILADEMGGAAEEGVMHLGRLVP
ncbi:hypothetical protein INR49_020078, partial [Caranx melampygus]